VDFILLAGPFNNLDLPFTVGHEDGTFQYPPQLGGGNATLRKQFRILRDFIYSSLSAHKAG
jgi:hypothetical protein